MGWKLFTGILGIIVGLFVIQNPLISTLVVPVSVAIMMGTHSILKGISQLVQTFRGAAWSLGVLGVLSITIGFLLITRPLVAELSLAFMPGILLILGGILVIFAAFSLRCLDRIMKRRSCWLPGRLHRLVRLFQEPPTGQPERFPV